MLLFYSKAEGIDYLSDLQYVASKSPGPGTYKADANKVKPTVLTTKFSPNAGSKRWKPVKTKDPDGGSYEIKKSLDFVNKSTIVHSFTSPKGSLPGAIPTSKEMFTTEVTRSKRFVPGVGSYTPKFDRITVPYLRKRS